MAALTAPVLDGAPALTPATLPGREAGTSRALPPHHALRIADWTADAVGAALRRLAQREARTLTLGYEPHRSRQARNAALLLLTLPGPVALVHVGCPRQLADPRSLPSFQRRALELRRTCSALRSDRLHVAPPEVDDVLVYERRDVTGHVGVALNFAATYRVLPVPLGTDVLVCTELDRRGALAIPELHLRGDEGVVFRLPADRPRP
jgi:hypothetical protein